MLVRNSTRVVMLILTILALQSASAGIVGSKHDLSPTNYYAGTPRDFGTNATDEICVFCHTPHGFNNDLDLDGTKDTVMPNGRANAPLWNRRISSIGGTYTPYKSATLNMTCDDTPSPVSLACLSCHDAAGGGGGIGAVSSVDHHALVNEPNSGPGWSTPKCAGCHPDGGQFPGKWWQIGPDMSNDHPVSMSFPTLADDPFFNIPPNLQTGWSDVKLFNGRVECPSCHNPHDPTNVPFLRKSNTGSALCYTCHNK